MIKIKNTKRALLMSALALIVCFAMLVGSTFAWFTDSVTSSNNIIKSGNLKVGMYWAEGNLDPTAVTNWNDASQGAIFKEALWEPGYTEAKHIKIVNEGNLALRYQMRILANGVVSMLADVIDVYYLDTAATLTRANIASATKLGTLSEVLNNANANAISATIAGNLERDKSKTVSIAFKMQESAGNEYQNLTIGSDFSIQLIATQYTSESDSFNNTYDANAEFAAQDAPKATVFAFSPEKLKGITIGSEGDSLDVGYSFQPTETYNQAIESEYCWAHADFFVYADKKVPANSMALAGYYNAFNGLSFGGQTLSPTNWIGLTADVDVEAGKENGLRLIADGMNGGVTDSGITVPYNAVCQYGNDGTGFLCGASDLTGANSGTTLTVELRLYKTYEDGKCPASHGGHSSKNCETGEYITVGTFTYTFPERPLTVRNTTELVDAIKNAPVGETTIVTLADKTYSGDMKITLADLGQQGGDIIIKAADGANPVITGTVTLGYRNQGVGAAMYNANITFDGVTFDHATAAAHSLDIQDVKSINLKNCKIIGDGEYGITSARGNGTGLSTFVGCTFENAGMQLLGNLATGLVIDKCTFNESCINVQAGNDVTVQNCVFNKTLTTANIDDSFYAIRSNSTPITVKNCKINIDSDLTSVVTTAQAKWYLLANRGTTNWTVTDVAVTLTNAALLQTELKITACTSTGKINTTNLTVNGVVQ